MNIWRKIFCCVILMPVLARANPATQPAPVTARVEIRHIGKPPEFVAGTVVNWDDTSVTIHVKTTDQTLKWEDLTGVSGYALRSQLIDKKDAQAWMKLGTLAWGLNDTRDAKIALARAAKLDASLKVDIEAVEASSGGILLDPPTKELMRDVDPDKLEAKLDKPDPRSAKFKYQKTTPGDAKTSMASTREDARKVAEEMQISLKEVETDHFLIFTDWDPSAYGFIKKNLEAANACVSKQFDILPTENIFVGKLGVYMFEKHDDFLKFGETFDHLPPSPGIAGYYASGGKVASHLAMSKPAIGEGHEQEVIWAYVLTHEFTHAFVARYRSSRQLPTWINEGIAEVIASSQFPRDVKPMAAEVAMMHISLAPLFNDRAGMQPGEMYPVMRTLTEVLILKDKKKFLVMFDELKAGATGARALKDTYGITFNELEKAWREYLGVR